MSVLDQLVTDPGEPGDRSHERWPITDVLTAFGWDGHDKASPNGWFKVRCPVHGERTPSAAYSEELNAFRCFACGARGNSVTLVMQQHRLEEEAAVAWLEQHVGSTGSPAQVSPRDRKAPTSRRRLPWEPGWTGS